MNGVGGALGDGQLGDKVGGALNQTTNGLLGPNGLTGSPLAASRPARRLLRFASGADGVVTGSPLAKPG